MGGRWEGGGKPSVDSNVFLRKFHLKIFFKEITNKKFIYLGDGEHMQAHNRHT